MGMRGGVKVMLPGYVVLWAVVTIAVPLAAASICAQGKQFLSTRLQTCVNCTECAEGDVVIRPCEIHRDTLCGPISELLKSMQPGAAGGGGGNPHRHKHLQRHKGRDEDIVWKYGDEVGAQERRGPPAAADAPPPASTEAPFSSAETLVWDWQAVALTAAVLVCILFFLVITLYSLHQAKQWRRLKDNFEADVEELSARLSLMAATTSEKGEALAPQLGPVPDGTYLNNRCVYLEHLLNVRKDTKPGAEGAGNVYIEGGGAATPGGGRA